MLKSIGCYPLGTPKQKMICYPIGYWEKRWGGGYGKSGLPDMHIVINGINIDVELKSSVGRPSELQKQCIRQMNQGGSIAMILYPEGFDQFKKIVELVMLCDTAIQELIPIINAHTNIKCDMLTS
ncbi:MAG: VRR-NUC domain-containing protein [Clostridiales bacterium]